MKTLLSLTIGFILGSLTGAVIALLNAPQSGEETRAQIQNEVAETRIRIGEAIADAQASTFERMDMIQGQINDLFQRASKKTEQINQEYS
jgi:gas vesicle protein